jgi:hypothetical protein
LQAKGKAVGNKVGPIGHLIHQLLIVRPGFFLAMTVGVPAKLIWSEQLKSEASWSRRGPPA